MFPELDSHSWAEVFAYAGETGTGNGSAHVNPVPGSTASSEPFERAQVTLLLGSSAGENDGASWVCAGRLRDGRWFCLRASCDYTGWDCQASGHASVSLSLADLLRLGMEPDERRRCRADVDLELLANASDEYVEREIAALVLRG